MKTFHVTGTCIPAENYMVDTSKKLDQIMQMIERKEYFVINRPRQYGKTTTISLLRRRLQKTSDYLPIKMSFERFDDSIFETPGSFCPTFLRNLIKNLCLSDNSYDGLFDEMIQDATDFTTLSETLSKIIIKTGKKVVLFIDEVDKSTNNELFLHFLGMLRDKYLNAREGDDITFHSVILAGVNDIKSLKQKIRPEAAKQYNSPWNIATDFKLDLSFSPAEIETMLCEYVSETSIQMDTKVISEKIHFWTSGYPFLVSYICKVIAEEIVTAQQSKTWEVEYIDDVVKKLETETNTLFDVMIKNLENYQELYDMIEGVVLGTREYKFNLSFPLTSQANMYGFISCDEKGNVQIHNRIFQLKIISYVAQRNKKEELYSSYTQKHYIGKDGRLNLEEVLLRFQEVMKANYSKTIQDKTDEFLERDLRLLFIMFLQPILNGKGFSFHEVEISEERRLDIVITFINMMYVVELKLWYGPAKHKEGKQQLKQYMQAMSIEKGYMLILDRSRKKAFKYEREDGMLMVFV